jgi:hypothetical protein
VAPPPPPPPPPPSRQAAAAKPPPPPPPGPPHPASSAIFTPALHLSETHRGHAAGVVTQIRFTLTQPCQFMRIVTREKCQWESIEVFGTDTITSLAQKATEQVPESFSSLQRALLSAGVSPELVNNVSAKQADAGSSVQSPFYQLLKSALRAAKDAGNYEVMAQLNSAGLDYVGLDKDLAELHRTKEAAVASEQYEAAKVAQLKIRGLWEKIEALFSTSSNAPLTCVAAESEPVFCHLWTDAFPAPVQYRHAGLERGKQTEAEAAAYAYVDRPRTSVFEMADGQPTGWVTSAESALVADHNEATVSGKLYLWLRGKFAKEALRGVLLCAAKAPLIDAMLGSFAGQLLHGAVWQIRRKIYQIIMEGESLNFVRHMSRVELETAAGDIARRGLQDQRPEVRREALKLQSLWSEAPLLGTTLGPSRADRQGVQHRAVASHTRRIPGDAYGRMREAYFGGRAALPC